MSPRRAAKKKSVDYRTIVDPQPVNEAALQNRVWRAIIAKYPNAWIFHPVGGPYQTPGIPDLLICIDGLLIAIELKHPSLTESIEHARARATPQQRKQIRYINIAGGYACVCVSVEESMRAIERAMTKHARSWGPRRK